MRKALWIYCIITTIAICVGACMWPKKEKPVRRVMVLELSRERAETLLDFLQFNLADEPRTVEVMGITCEEVPPYEVTFAATWRHAEWLESGTYTMSGLMRDVRLHGLPRVDLDW